MSESPRKASVAVPGGPHMSESPRKGSVAVPGGPHMSESPRKGSVAVPGGPHMSESPRKGSVAVPGGPHMSESPRKGSMAVPRLLFRRASGTGEGAESDPAEVVPAHSLGAAGVAFVQNALASNARRVVDFLKDWHRNKDGNVSREELRTLCDRLMIDAPMAAIDGVFALWDDQKTGRVSLIELERTLKVLSRAVSAAHAPKASIPPFRTKNPKSLRRHGPTVGADVARADAIVARLSDATALDEAHRYLMRHAWRMIGLFEPPPLADHEWDVSIGRSDWEKACLSLGFPGDAEAAARLFDSLAGPAAKSLPLAQLKSVVRPGGRLPSQATEPPRYVRSPRAERVRRAAAGGARPIPARLPAIVGIRASPAVPSRLPGIHLTNDPPQRGLTASASVPVWLTGFRHRNTREGPGEGGRRARDTGGEGSSLGDRFRGTGGEGSPVAGGGPSHLGEPASPGESPKRASFAPSAVLFSSVGGGSEPAVAPQLQRPGWIFDRMWRRGELKLRMRIADTILLEAAELGSWLFTDKEGNVKRKNRDKLAPAVASAEFERSAAKLHKLHVGAGTGYVAVALSTSGESTLLTAIALSEMMRDSHFLQCTAALQLFVPSHGGNGTQYRCDYTRDGRHALGATLAVSKVAFLGVQGPEAKPADSNDGFGLADEPQVCIYLYLSIYLSICMYVCIYVSVSIYLSIYLSIYIHTSLCLLLDLISYRWLARSFS